MSAFGKRSGIGGAAQRPAFGVARPMHGPDGSAPAPSAEAALPSSIPDAVGGDAMARLASRQAGSGDAAAHKAEGFDASVHKIKEQVLPRLLERVDPEAAATLSKDELAEEFRPIIMRGAGRAEAQPQPPRAVRAGEGAGRRAARLWPARRAAGRSGRQRHHGQRPGTDLHRKEGQAPDRADPFPRRGASLPDRPAHREQGRPPRRPDHAAGRRPPARRLSRQRHRAAAVAARHRHLDP